MVKCRLCNQKLGRITHTHLWHKHQMLYCKFIKQFPGANAGVISWNNGESKETHPSLLRLSQTLKAKKEWNFSNWQRKRKLQGIELYRKLKKDVNLAELIGIVLGDGNLYKHLRTENLRITCNSKDTGYIKHISNLIRKVFCKSPAIRKRNDVNAVSIDLYQCKISERLNLPCGDKIRNNVGIPQWIFPIEDIFLNV